MLPLTAFDNDAPPAAGSLHGTPTNTHALAHTLTIIIIIVVRAGAPSPVVDGDDVPVLEVMCEVKSVLRTPFFASTFDNVVETP